jgi:hypothetical protein
MKKLAMLSTLAKRAKSICNQDRLHAEMEYVHRTFRQITVATGRNQAGLSSSNAQDLY